MDKDDDVIGIEAQSEVLVEKQVLVEQDEIVDSENQKRVSGKTASYKDLKFPVSKYPEK